MKGFMKIHEQCKVSDITNRDGSILRHCATPSCKSHPITIRADKNKCEDLPKNYFDNCGEPDLCIRHKCGVDSCNCPKIYIFTHRMPEQH